MVRSESVQKDRFERKSLTNRGGKAVISKHHMAHYLDNQGDCLYIHRYKYVALSTNAIPSLKPYLPQTCRPVQLKL